MTQPNIVFILMDDLGWMDLSCYGSSFYETPNLDRLATEGMRFTDAYASCPVCSPTRASILTGKYPATVGVTNYIDCGGGLHPSRGRVIDAPYIDHIPPSENTLAAALRDGGYQTWHVGRWHLGGKFHLGGDADFYPEKYGFDVNVGGCFWGCPVTYFSPWHLPVMEDGPEGEYLTDHITDAAIDLIRNREDRPFFLNLWHYAVHTPIEAPAELVAKYEDKARKMGLDTVQAIVEGENFAVDHKKHQRIERRIIQSDPVYAAMVENMDWNIGRVLSALEEEGLADNTIVIFTSDNGGLATAEGSPTCNRPLAEGKGWMYEGGAREPLIVRWPGVTQPGSVCEVPTTSPDFYPTFLEMAGLPLIPRQHCDGVSIAPLLRGEDSLEREAIFWHYPHYGNQGGSPGASVRVGDWKLIEFFEDNHIELYNLCDDISEEHNLADRQPEQAVSMRRTLEDWQRRVNALIPEPNPEWSAK